MPIYEFNCEACGKHFEQMRSIRDESTPDCPSCEGRDVRRLMSPTSFQLKGSGWYATDYKTTKAKGGTASKETSGGVSAKVS